MAPLLSLSWLNTDCLKRRRSRDTTSHLGRTLMTTRKGKKHGWPQCPPYLKEYSWVLEQVSRSNWTRKECHSSFLPVRRLHPAPVRYAPAKWRQKLEEALPPLNLCRGAGEPQFLIFVLIQEVKPQTRATEVNCAPLPSVSHELSSRTNTTGLLRFSVSVCFSKFFNLKKKQNKQLLKAHCCFNRKAEV